MKISFYLLPILVLAVSLAVSVQSRAGDYEDEKHIAEGKAHFDEKLKDMNDKCGTKIKATYDLKTEKYERERWDGTNKKWFMEPNRESGQFRLVAGYGYDSCATVFTAIKSACEEDAFKAMVKKKITKIKCEFKHLNKFETELTSAYDKKHTVPPGYQAWEVDAQKDAIRHEYKNGVLTTFFDYDLSNEGQYTLKYLKKKL